MDAGRWQGDDYFLQVCVQPRSSREGVTGVRGTEIRIALNAPPVDGAANQALIRFIAREMGIAKGRVKLVSGEKSRNKRLCLKNVPRENVQAFLVQWGLSTTD
ncbi:MAG: YggU family protein [Magnetococcales bacterium]|nr:YggU family protein [Magnetococcales bacterium]MBF0149014.1 YggU family protein [Magnetococcales bacterium]MBF0172063.1 YggU family protein [Magnetococcales bacterium]MBF0346176.1 YggU family protein [Magnetococcales bacterium]MBF0630332.1 YggU family protein [Magnetococcales bacterium]